ncbi:MAG: AAA family ATPase [Eubacteriales bacterium]|jgi:DNA sulfur modification protein DndD
MKINNIILHNFGSYEGTTNFDTRPCDGRNIVLIGGKNGAGKTTLFTAMRLCLYGYKSMGYKNPNSFYNRAVVKLVNNTAKITKPATAFVTMCVELNNGQGMDSFLLTRKWELNESLIETFSVLKNGADLSEDEIADFEKYVVSLIPPELFNLYFFDGEKIADFFMDEGSNTRIKEAFLTLCGYDTFDIMRKNFKRIRAGIPTSAPALDEYIVAKDTLASAESLYHDLTDRLKACVDAIADCEATLDAEEKEYHQKGGITEEEWNQKLYTLKEEEKKRETYNALLKKWANDVIPFIMLRKQILSLKEQMENENQALKYTFFCEVLNSPAVQALVKDKLAEIDSAAFADFGTEKEPILNLSFEQNSLILAQINTILSFEQDKVEKCKKAIKRSLNLTAKIRKEIDSSSITSVQEYMKRRAQLFEEKSALLVQRVELEQQLVAQKEALTLAEQQLGKVQTRLEEELKKASINDISARAIVMLDKLQEILYRRQIDKVENCFRKEIRTLMRKTHFIDDIYIDDNFNTHIYRTEKVSIEKIRKALKTNTEEQLLAFWGAKAMQTLYKKANSNAYNDMCKYFESVDIKSLSLQIEIDKASLSNGEKQIFIMALYYSLVSLCNHELPFVIDTPFARIDTEHRHNISKHFFSELKGQVFILSTNEEINSSHVQILKDKIAATYMLENSDNKRTVVVKNSYFEV